MVYFIFLVPRSLPYTKLSGFPSKTKIQKLQKLFSYLVQMADKVKSIDECILTANNLRTTVRKVFQDLAASPGVKREKAESSESSKGENITRLLKKNLTEVHKVLRYALVKTDLSP